MCFLLHTNVIRVLNLKLQTRALPSIVISKYATCTTRTKYVQYNTIFLNSFESLVGIDKSDIGKHIYVRV